MSLSIGKYMGIQKAVGEILSIDGKIVSIFIYPEKYRDISVGEIIIVNSETYFPIMVVSKNVHRARREQGFIPIKTGYEAMKEIYPDADRLYIYAASSVLVAYTDADGVLRIGYGPSPRLHDLAYPLDPDDRINLFLSNSGEPNFDMLKYLFSEGVNPIIFREFIQKNRCVIESISSKEDVFKSLFNTLIDIVPSQSILRVLIKEFLSLMRWKHEYSR